MTDPDDRVIGLLAVGHDGNVITVEVTAEDGNTGKTYKVTVTRAAPAERPMRRTSRPAKCWSRPEQ